MLLQQSVRHHRWDALGYTVGAQLLGKKPHSKQKPGARTLVPVSTGSFSGCGTDLFLPGRRPETGDRGLMTVPVCPSLPLQRHFDEQCSRGLLQPLAKAGTRPSSSLMVLIPPKTAFHPRIRQNLITTISASLRPVFHLSAELLTLIFSALGEELWHQGYLGAYFRLCHKPDPESGSQISIF